jgi:hypothetical protein
MGVILPLRSVKAMAMAVPSVAVTVIETSCRGSWAKLEKARTCM